MGYAEVEFQNRSKLADTSRTIGPEHREVQIHEVDFLAGPEILVADVAPAHDRDPVVGDPALVVHPPVHALEAQGALARLRQRPFPRDPRVEHAHFDAWMRRQRRQAVVHRTGVEVVQQESHANAAVGRFQQGLAEIRAGEVRVPDVGLHVEAAGRESRALHAHHEGLRAVAQQPEAGLAGVRVLDFPDAFGHARFLQQEPMQ